MSDGLAQESRLPSRALYPVAISQKKTQQKRKQNPREKLSFHVDSTVPIVVVVENEGCSDKETTLCTMTFERVFFVWLSMSNISRTCQTNKPLCAASNLDSAKKFAFQDIVHNTKTSRVSIRQLSGNLEFHSGLQLAPKAA